MTEENKKIRAWHFCEGPGEDGVVRTRYSGAPVVVGEAMTVDGPLELCARGLHASRLAIDALGYAPGPVACLVELSGEIIEGDDKLCARTRTVVAMADASAVLREFACWCAERALMREREAGREPDPRSWAAVAAARAFLRGEISAEALAHAAHAASAATYAHAASATYAAAYAAAHAAAAHAAHAAAHAAAAHAAAAHAAHAAHAASAATYAHAASATYASAHASARAVTARAAASAADAASAYGAYAAASDASSSYAAAYYAAARAASSAAARAAADDAAYDDAKKEERGAQNEQLERVLRALLGEGGKDGTM